MENKLYHYTIEFYKTGKVKTNIIVSDIVIETEEQIVYKSYNKYFILDLKTISGVSEPLVGAYYVNYYSIDEEYHHFSAYGYFKEKSKKNENKVISALKKEIKKYFSFINIDDIKIEFKNN